jgi:hypothetical protein
LLTAAKGEAQETTLYVIAQILCEFYAIVTNTERGPLDALPGSSI